MVYGGFTLGAQDQPGAEGSGVLATITWRVVQPADFTATLSRVQLAGPGGQALPGSDTSPPPAASADLGQPGRSRRAAHCHARPRQPLQQAGSDARSGSARSGWW